MVRMVRVARHNMDYINKLLAIFNLIGHSNYIIGLKLQRFAEWVDFANSKNLGPPKLNQLNEVKGNKTNTQLIEDMCDANLFSN